MTTDLILDIDGLAVDLAGRRVLDNVRLRVTAGELVGLIGPNGAGKTTLLRAVLGLIPATAGVVRLSGGPPKAMAGQIGYVPQRHEFAWDFPINVEKAVLSGLTHRTGWLRPATRDHRAAVAEALDRVDLTQLRRRPIGELSGGQRQRVLVARALALSPSLLLLDEPFTGLDVPTRQLLTELCIHLRESGMALLMTTHDLAAAADTCTRLCLLNRTVIADGPPEKLTDPDTWLDAFGVRRSELIR